MEPHKIARMLTGTFAVVGMLTEAIFLSGCSKDASSAMPSEKMAQDFFATVANKSSGTEVQVESFTKVNALKREENGLQTYDMEFKATIVFPKGRMPECVNSKYSYINHTKQEQTCFEARQRAGIGATPFLPMGTKETVEGAINFEKAENGWRATGFERK